MKMIKRARKLSSKTKAFDIESINQCLLNHVQTNNSTITLLIIKGKLDEKSRVARKRILAEADTEGPLIPAATSVAESSDNIIYVKPDAIFAILLSIFLFFITYVGVMCLFNTKTPKGFASKPFKFGREL